MQELYETVSAGDPYEGKEIKITYTLVAAASSSEEHIFGEIKQITADGITVETDSGSQINLKERWGSLHIYNTHGHLGPVQDISGL